MDKRNASRITSSRSLKNATFHLTGWILSHQAELPGDLPVPLECHALTLNTIELQLSDAFAYKCMLHCSAKFLSLFISAHFVADNASNAFASSATITPTFNIDEVVVVIRNGLTQREDEEDTLNFHLFFYSDYFLFVACYDVFIQGCLRFSLCFTIANYLKKCVYYSRQFDVTLELTLNRFFHDSYSHS